MRFEDLVRRARNQLSYGRAMPAIQAELVFDGATPAQAVFAVKGAAILLRKREEP